MDDEVDFSECWSCGLCGRNDTGNNNDYVICSQCEITVHLRCAGLSRNILKQATFTCPFCKSHPVGEDPTLKESGRICKLCPINDRTGTVLYMKEDNGKDKDKQRYNKQTLPNASSSNWIHGVCMHSCNRSLEGIMDFFPIKCSYCTLDNGMFFVCGANGCSTPLHMSCALMRSKIRRVQDSSSSSSSVQFVAFCKDHELLVDGVSACTLIDLMQM